MTCAAPKNILRAGALVALIFGSAGSVDAASAPEAAAWTLGAAGAGIPKPPGPAVQLCPLAAGPGRPDPCSVAFARSFLSVSGEKAARAGLDPEASRSFALARSSQETARVPEPAPGRILSRSVVSASSSLVGAARADLLAAEPLRNFYSSPRRP